MTITIADAVDGILAKPSVPVILIDTCSFIDLFRRDPARYQPRVTVQEIQAAADLVELMNVSPDAAHLLLPELIPREYSDHADREEATFRNWTLFHDQNQDWLAEASLSVALALPQPLLIHPFGLAARLRNLADDLLGKFKVLDRDQGCLDRAVNRLINKSRPSHKKEVKDSMNLEQCLELSRQLQNAGFTRSRIWVSSNINDFAGQSGTQIHPDLELDFTTAGLKYFTSLQAALGHLRAAGEI